MKRSLSTEKWKLKWGRHIEAQLVLSFLQYFGLATFTASLKQYCTASPSTRLSMRIPQFKLAAVVALNKKRGSGGTSGGSEDHVDRDGSNDSANHHGHDDDGGGGGGSGGNVAVSHSLVSLDDDCGHALTFAHQLSVRLKAFALADLHQQISKALVRLLALQRETQKAYAKSTGVAEIFQRLRTDYVRQVALR